MLDPPGTLWRHWGWEAPAGGQWWELGWDLILCIPALKLGWKGAVLGWKWAGLKMGCTALEMGCTGPCWAVQGWK